MTQKKIRIESSEQAKELLLLEEDHRAEEIFNSFLKRFTFSLRIAGEGRCFQSESKKNQYRSLLRIYDKEDNDKGGVYLQKLFWTKELKDRPYEAGQKPVGGFVTAEGKPLYEHFERGEAAPTWPYLLKRIGKLLKEDPVLNHVCYKCGGTGIIPEFSHVDGGICFECLGVGRWIKYNKNL
jgi:hypothetical protein